MIVGLKRRETIVSLVQTSVRYAAYGLAVLFTLIQIAGLGSNGALAGASLIVVLLGFALQRFLIDILTGFFMQFEGWFSIGDSITIEPYGLAGIVEEISLRSTKLRALSGELLYVHNSQLLARAGAAARPARGQHRAVRAGRGRGPRPVRAGGARDADRPDRVRPPSLDRERRSGSTRISIHIRARATLAPGREWLAERLPRRTC